MIDLLLLLMTVLWGTNYTIVKRAFREIDPQAFNALRLIIASTVFLLIIAGARLVDEGEPDEAGPETGVGSVFRTRARMTAREWGGLAALGVVGHCIYQYCFMAGLARTSVANSALMLGLTPVLVAILAATLGLEGISRRHWLGAAISLTGIYLVVGQGFAPGSHGAAGDLLMAGAVCCWAIYTIGARPLMTRHSPVAVTGLSMMIGTAIYVPLMAPALWRVDWAGVSASTWGWLVFSALFSLNVAYTIWYAGIRQIGPARTSVYSNLVPIVAMVTAVVFLGEPVSARKLLGAAAVIGGVALTRLGGPRSVVPPQE